MAKDSKNRALEMRRTDNRLNVSKPGADITMRHKKVAHLPSMDMEKRRKMMGQRSTSERIEHYKGDDK